MFDQTARDDFSKAMRKAFFQNVFSWLSRKTNSLLPYDAVRAALPIEGQRYLGLQAIPINKIVGSMGRYHEFTRAFLPTERYLEQRWVNISRAQYQDINLPPIEVFKIGEVYFVRDGNHRVSVGRQSGRKFMDAYVTEISIPVSLTTETTIEDLEMKKKNVAFLQQTQLHQLFPEAKIEVSLKGEIARLYEHIETHQYYLGLEKEIKPSYEEAVKSWYLEVYSPLVKEIDRQELHKVFTNLTQTDLYLLVSEYQWFLREAYADNAGLEQAKEAFSKSLDSISREARGSTKGISRKLQNAPWIDQYILRQEKDAFTQQTGINLTATAPGAYANLLQHIHDHRWFLGIEANKEIEWGHAVSSWHENVYLPMAVLIDEMDILQFFPDRTKTDLYLWIISHRMELSESLGWEIPAEKAARDFIDSKTGSKTAVENRPVSADEMLNLSMFSNILVPLSDRPNDLNALDQALIIAQRNQGSIYGLHVISSQDEHTDLEHERLENIFTSHCKDHNVRGEMAFENGTVSRLIANRANWMDLVVLPLNYPPKENIFAKFSSGFRYVLRRSGKPVLAVPGEPSNLNRILLAYDGSPLADKALFIASCMMSFWEDTSLFVITAGEKHTQSAAQLARAQSFLDAHMIKASYVRAAGPASDSILAVAEEKKCDVIFMGGYGERPIRELAIGSTLDKVLRQTNIPVLIRT